MPVNPRKHQKQKERRAAKRKAKQQVVIKEKHASVPERIAASARYPVLHAWATTDLWDQGIGWVCLSREVPNGQVAFVIFLVDRYCLGVKNVWFDVLPRPLYESRVLRKVNAEYVMKNVSPATVRKFVEGSVAYAESFGLHPHADYHKGKPIFGDINPAESTEELEFGRDGQPYFVAGPYDSPERNRRIMKALEATAGAGRFHYTIPLADPSKVLPQSLRGEGLTVQDLMALGADPDSEEEAGDAGAE